MKSIIIDIETEPGKFEELAGMVPKFEAPVNYKDPVKIQENINAQQIKWLEKAALSAITGRVLAVGMIVMDFSGQDHTEEELILIKGRDGDEREILEKTFAVIRDNLIVTWNGFRFDVPFLVRRGWATKAVGVPTSRCIKGVKNDENHVDLMASWCLGVAGEMESLDSVAQCLGVGKKSGSGKFFSQLYKDDPEAAIRYLQQDLRLTRDVAFAMGIL